MVSTGPLRKILIIQGTLLIVTVNKAFLIIEVKEIHGA